MCQLWYIKRHNPNLVTLRYAEPSLEFQNQVGPIFFNAYSEKGSNNQTGPSKRTGWIVLTVEQGEKVNLGQNSQLKIQK